MRDYKIYILLLGFIFFALIGAVSYCVFGRACTPTTTNTLDYIALPQNTTTTAPVATTPASHIATTSPCVPDMTTPCNSDLQTPIDLTNPVASTSNGIMPITPILEGRYPTPAPTILSAGSGTTTFSNRSPFNDILIAESGSEFASLRNARYAMWPLPGEILFKEIYLILPDVYTPISPGYSNEQFIVSADGTKQVMLHLRHKENTDMGADTKVFIQAPVTTDEADHAMTAIESTTGGATYSLVTKGQEVIVEVTYLKAAGISAEHSTSAHEELLRAIEKMEIIW